MNFEHGDGDEDYLLNGNESYATNHRHFQELQRLSAFQQVTTKVPPSYDGRSSWFAYEDAIDDWCDITELDGDKRGPALRNRLEGEAAIHKRLLDRDRLKDPNNGVKYFKSFLRPLFVKGAANVFLYRFQQFMNLHRGNGDMLRWITRFQLSVQRMQEAWNDTYLPITDPMNAEGYLDNQEGYWVEDEEDGTEGFLEADDDAFWKGKKGKGKGKFGKHDGKDGKGGSKDGAANLADTAQGSAAIAAAYAVQSTEFDIVEQGHVPTLMSLPQMRNLRFQFDLQPDKAFLSSSVLGIENMQLKVAPSSHLVLDLIDLSEYMWHVRFGKFKKSSFLTYYMHYEYGFHQKLSGGSSFEEVPEEPEGLVFATDDEWVVDENKMELIRVHKKTRQVKYAPKEGQTPIPLEFLD
ncbi:Cpr, partial [Symbiodinium sp. KB8]